MNVPEFITVFYFRTTEIYPPVIKAFFLTPILTSGLQTCDRSTWGLTFPYIICPNVMGTISI
jgi:hypothetical protein